MRAAIILNPGAGTSPIARQHITEQDFEAVLLQTLRDLGIEAEVFHTTLEDPGKDIAHQLALQHTELVIAVGGDGTVHAVARGLLGTQSVLGIIPAGTMNNLAFSLGIPENLSEACALFVNGLVRNIDVGRINQHTFLEVAGVGLEAALFPAAEEVKSPGLLSTIKGAVSGLSTLLRFRPPHMTVTFDNEKARTYRAIQLTVCNAPYYGLRLNVAPDIFMDDGWLDAVIYTNFSKSEYIRHAISISQGRRPFAPKIIHRRVKRLLVRTNEASELQADGCAVGQAPAEITVVPAILKVQVPANAVPGLMAEKQELVRRKRRFKRKSKIYV